MFDKLKYCQSLFMCVNPGYNKEVFSVTDAHEASRRVAEAVGSDGVNADIFPGRIVYGLARQCPLSGDPMGALLINPQPMADPPLENLNKLRKKLGQTTASLVDPACKTDKTTQSLFLCFKGLSLEKVAQGWHELSEKFSAPDSYVSAGFWAMPAGDVYAEASANPWKIKPNSMEAWKTAAQNIISEIKPVRHEFRPIDFYYLRD